ncbi:hypothetical protein LWI28_012888 [Acer negundo]|uniref:Uncharacterized protein n=1 Tax=Acer negundo TaxID=4023 RepID=A0AAD5NVL1_ACENE|nr:hypothetical protein LWI28_012888 [Acer negundo]
MNPATFSEDAEDTDGAGNGWQQLIRRGGNIHATSKFYASDILTLSSDVLNGVSSKTPIFYFQIVTGSPLALSESAKRDMGKIGLLVNYDGHWDGAQFMGSSPFGVCVSMEEKHDQLLEKIYRWVGVNRDRFELKLSTMANTKTENKILPILCDGDDEFVLVNAECTLEVFVEVIERPVAALETIHVHQTPRKAIPMHQTSFSKDAEDSCWRKWEGSCRKA